MLKSKDKNARIQSTIEFPLIGFVLGPFLFTKDDWNSYILIDSGENTSISSVLSQFLGFHRKDNPLHMQVKVGFPFVWHWFFCSNYCVSPYENAPEFLSFGQIIFYAINYPLSKSFRNIMLGENPSGFTYSFCYLILFPWGLANSIALFSISLPFLFMMTLVYGQKHLLGRILFDLPNFCMALTYTIVIEPAYSSVFSLSISAFMIFYYLYKVIMKDYGRTFEPHFPLNDIYGKLSPRQALNQAIFAPLIWIFYMPLLIAYLVTKYLLSKTENNNVVIVIEGTIENAQDEAPIDGSKVGHKTEVVASPLRFPLLSVLK